MTDIVERLNDEKCFDHWALREDAADEIERLQAELKRLRALLERMDDAYRVVTGRFERLRAVAAGSAKTIETLRNQIVTLRTNVGL